MQIKMELYNKIDFIKLIFKFCFNDNKIIKKTKILIQF